ncbi:MAG: IS66 family transposase [Sphingomonas sp.]
MTHEETLATKDALIAALLKQNASLLARISLLEAKLGLPPKGPDNSSLPPSGGQKASGSAKAKRKKKPHAGAHRALHPNPTRHREVLADTCPGCGADVSGVEQSPCAVYDRIEIPKIEPDVTRVVLHGGICPCCAGRFKATAPVGLEPGSPFGPELRAYAIYLRSVQGIPLARLSALFKDLFGLDISEGALVNILRAARSTFAGQAERLKADLKAGTVIASDETGLRVGKKNRWLWAFHHGPTALFLADQSRAKVVVEGFLGDWRPDYWISDRYGGQRGWSRKGHQFCLAHLIRDTRYHIDAGDTLVAPAFMGLLKRACAIGRRRDQLNDAQLAAHRRKLVRRMSCILALVPICDPGRKMIKIIQKLRHNLFVFVTNRELSATNNGSERALRPCAVYRKITNGFRSQWAATLYADIRSAVETGRRRHIRAIDAIRISLAGQTLTASD